MPQELHVLQCYNCETFQVDIVKKVPKWVCKMCGEKQSVKKIFGTGTGKECRLFVQSLNEQRLEHPECHPQDVLEVEMCQQKSDSFVDNSQVKESKWSQFTEIPQDPLDKREENTQKESIKNELDVSCDNIFEDKDCELDSILNF